MLISPEYSLVSLATLLLVFYSFQNQLKVLPTKPSSLLCLLKNCKEQRNNVSETFIRAVIYSLK